MVADVVAIVSAVRDVGRLGEFTSTFVRHAFAELLARAGLPLGTARSEDGAKVTFAARLRLALQELGLAFMKLGQIVSTRTDLIPADVCVELKKLQDGVPPISDDEVHGIRETIERDIDLLYFLARLLERAVPELRVYSPVGLVSEFDRAFFAELDFGLPIAADRLGRRVGSAIVLSAFVLSGAHLMASGKETVGTAAFVVAGALAALMLLSHVFGDARRKGRP